MATSLTLQKQQKGCIVAFKSVGVARLWRLVTTPMEVYHLHTVILEQIGARDADD